MGQEREKISTQILTGGASEGGSQAPLECFAAGLKLTLGTE